jgi:predicted RNase H-like nuclease
MKRGILGIDAAWTERAPSGVAWLVEEGTGWRVAGCAPSYAEFFALAEGQPVDWTAVRSSGGSWPDIEALLAAAQRIERADARVVAVDMPLAIGPCIARRAADNAISSAFGARGCATHSPTPERPGKLGMDLMRQLYAAGFPLAVAQPSSGRSDAASTPLPTEPPAVPLAAPPAVPLGAPPAAGPAAHSIEVYPHPALLRLLGAGYRIPYKVSRSTQYWRGESIETRIGRLLEEFGRIEAGLARELGATSIALPAASSVSTLSSLKRFEDALDALICGWIGSRFLVGRADAFGDASAAVWVPAADSRRS